ncbi:DUF2065 domain-containing protein [Alteromonas facilis]|uniref:DUF2065 domain-containing protein n=1 Tax=Alteromonas facilis TaxID=2048004 RepID=UPI00196B1E79|nr:DUF2065 domain-containing protein [Alteromonas facilis]
MDTSTWLIALSMVLIIEGIGPLLFPKRWQKFMFSISLQPANELRRVGGILVVIGGISVWFLLR